MYFRNRKKERGRAQPGRGGWGEEEEEKKINNF